MTNIIDEINGISFRYKDEDESAYEMEYKEHYEDILEVVKDPDLAKRIVRVIPKGHYRENERYYVFLKKMEREMNS